MPSFKFSGVRVMASLLLLFPLFSAKSYARPNIADGGLNFHLKENLLDSRSDGLNLSMEYPLGESSSPPHLSYDEAVVKGKQMIALMDSSPNCPEPKQSGWTKFEQLKSNGWEEQFNMFLPIPDGVNEGIWKAAQLIGVNNEGTDHGSNRLIDWKWRSANYGQYYNVPKGVIFCQSLWSPTGRGYHRDDIPALHSWSDVTFLQWQELASTSGKVDALHHVVHSLITSKDTKHIMQQVANGQLEKQEHGYEFHLGSNEFVALMGTPNARGSAYLLAQHKAQLGWKRVKSIRIFASAGVVFTHYQMILNFELHPQASTQRRKRSHGLVGHGPRSDRGESSTGSGLQTQNVSDDSNEFPLSYEDAAARGRMLAELLESPPESSEDFQSRWTDIKDLERHGWKKTFDFFKSVPEINGTAWWETAKLVGVDNEGPNNSSSRRIDWWHKKTNGEYAQVYNVEKGVILCHAIQSPEARSAQGTSLPAVHHWSDITMLQWRELTRQIHTELRFVAHPLIHNKATLGIMRQVTQDKLHEAVVPGREYFPTDEEFAALLGTPNAMGTAYLLAQHKKQLGWRRIESIRIFASSKAPVTSYNMILKIAPHPKALSDNAKRGLSDDLAEVEESLSASPALEEAIQAGKAAAAQMDDQTTGSTSGVWDSIAALHQWGWIEDVSDYGLDFDRELATMDNRIITILQSEGLLSANSSRKAQSEVFEKLDRGDAFRECYRHSKTMIINDTTYPATQAKHCNWYFKRFIFAVDNSSPAMMAKETSGDSNGNPTRLPELQHWSQISHLMYKEHFPTEVLRGVIRLDVIEKRSMRVIEALNAKANPPIDRLKFEKRLTFKPGDFQYYALLGIPNGKGVMWLLTQYRDSLGFKCVKEIDFWTNSFGAGMLWYRIGNGPCLEQVQAPEVASSSYSGGQRRTDDKLRSHNVTVHAQPDHLTKKATKNFNLDNVSYRSSLTLEQAVRKGEEMSALFNGGPPAQSEWTNFQSLIDWGWSADGGYTSEGPIVYNPSGNDSSVKTVFDHFYGRDDSIQVYGVDWKHSKPTDHDGRHYPASDGYYMNHYSPKVIFASNNESPASMRNRKSSQTSTIDESPLPRLQRWSDVVYLQQAERNKELQADVSELQAVVRCGIAWTSPTFKIIEQITNAGKMGSRVDFADAWTFNAGSKEYNAMMGVPHGKSVAWLLLQHQEQFGRKCVGEIKVWWERSTSPNVLYLLKNC